MAVSYVMGAQQEKIAEEMDLNATTISDYSIEVDGLPPDTTEVELRAHFERQTRWRVHDVYIAKNVHEFLWLRSTLANQRDELEVAERLIEKTGGEEGKEDKEAIIKRYSRYNSASTLKPFYFFREKGAGAKIDLPQGLTFCLPPP